MEDIRKRTRGTEIIAFKRQFFMRPYNQKTTRREAINDLPKGRLFKFFLIISQEIVSQKDEMKMGPWRIQEKVVYLPRYALFLQILYCKKLVARFRSKISG